jgi:hypothetical protein
MEPETAAWPERLGRLTIRQYPGFLIDLSNVRDLNGFMSQTFSKSSRYKLQKYKKRLESCFNIRYRMYYGEINEPGFKKLFDKFRELLEKRFADKQVVNNNLDPGEWNFYMEVAYPMILEKKAALFVVYNGQEPIALTLNYLMPDVLIDAITVFDTDYSKFHLGSVNIMQQIAWCLENKIGIFDFSKGYFDYKKRWGNREYDFKYHIYYDKKSFKASFLAHALGASFRLKQWLRERNINEHWHKLKYRFRTKKDMAPQQIRSYTFEEAGSEVIQDDYRLVNRQSEEYGRLKKAVFDFLYLRMENEASLQIFMVNPTTDTYLFKGVNNQAKVTL